MITPCTRWFFVVTLLSLAVISAQLSTACAQGTAFTYQGRLNDGVTPANGSYDFRFRLAADNLGNTYLGSPYAVSSLAVSNGLFLATIDFGTGIFTGNTNWLEVDVRTNGTGGYTVLYPLQAIKPTPYAIFAATASNVSGTVSAAQISGALASANLTGTYGNTLTLTSAANSFSGSGANLTSLNANNLASGTVPLARLGGITSNQLDAATWQLATNLNAGNAATLGGLSPAGLWQLGGNNVASGQFLGSTNNQPVELRANGQRALRLEPNASGAPNLIGGSPANFVSSGIVGATIGGGGATNYSGSHQTNSVTGDFGTVGGGLQNIAGNNWATVGGGSQNIARGLGATVGGGNGNTANNSDATIGGGEINTASGSESTVGGGYQNAATGAGAVVAGGGNVYDAVGNTASGDDSTVGGGDNNFATNIGATVPGGVNNIAGGQYSFAAGDGAQALHQGAFVWADTKGAAFASTTTNEFNIRSQNGVRIQADKGVHLNAADEPIIVRDWDVFATNAPAAKAGIGRWGLFMEPTILTLGIPDTNTAVIAPRYFQIAKYSTNGTPTQLVQVDQSGSLTAQGVITAAAFSGGGTSLTSVNAAALGGLSATGFWQTGGNAGTTPGVNFLGTTDNEPLDLYVNNVRAMRYRLQTDAEGFYTNAPNVVGGSSVNTTTSGVVGATIAGGGGIFYDGESLLNKVSADFGTIGGGQGNTASGGFATVAGGGGYDGYGNVASGDEATVSGGDSNTASGDNATVSGGYSNTASGESATVAGGYGNIASGDKSFAAGAYAKAGHNGSFVWADTNYFTFSSTVANGFFVRCTGGAKFVTAIDGAGNATAGVHILAGETAWSSISDRNAKKNFQPVNGAAVLEMLAAIPVEKWNYKWEADTNTPHIGPMAQDFKHVFYPGRDDKGITTLEFDGVELAAIQGLNQKLNEKDAEIQELKARLEKLEQLMTAKIGGAK